MSDSELLVDFSPFFQIYKDGRINRIDGIKLEPPLDPDDGVRSKDVVYSLELNLSSIKPHKNLTCRVHIPENTTPGHKLPLLVYFHGGAFCMESPFTHTYYKYHKSLVKAANVVAVAVEYRLVPEHPLPAAYDDCWTALKWLASHFNGSGPEEWLNAYADFGKVFFAGDSAGGNIAHQMAIRFGQEKLVGVDLKGIALIHPYFWGKDPIGNESKDPEGKAIMEKIWYYVHPTTTGLDDPLINPIADPNLASLGCSRVFIFAAEKDVMRDRAWLYYEELKKCGWEGSVEIMESKGEVHTFHLYIDCENTKIMLEKFASFLNQ
ncbi:hypothetical protein K2173_002267 [Erythroxylum novogranatense]|uniref:Alpha/beta hydrolase fold-3 domain-containing protein n=1 Tax=Erythroxylum novogranatense TaxID=1862640 RepID=A0AAV8TAK6_9ROSI|nr:hypothetical protein K2173_002267 [Erythroxylum novogranatense]